MPDGTPAPQAILRGHKAQIHATTFIRRNERLATGDADGFVVLWDLTTMRARAVWTAHEKAILGIRGWGQDKIITHGRDHKLIVWQVSLNDEQRLSTDLPLEDVTIARPQPWIVHMLEVNTMNFCAFAACDDVLSGGSVAGEAPAQGMLLAVPNTLISEAIDIYKLPAQSRIHTIKPGQSNGMAMCLSLLHYSGALTLLAAFENGFASVHRLESDGQWITTYRTQAHSQPVLSLDMHPGGEFFLTSAADAIIAKHPIPTTRQEVSAAIPKAAGGSVERSTAPDNRQKPSLLSAALAGDTNRVPPRAQTKEWEHPLKTINTKHSGQQSLQIRSDGRIFATAGWDSNLRVYSTKTLKELAVLQWHKVGAYAVGFANLAPVASETSASTAVHNSAQEDKQNLASASIPSASDLVLNSDIGSLSSSAHPSVKDRRIRHAQTAHWIAGGSKDGKVSLWDIY